MGLNMRSRKRKGADWEREVARRFREAMPGSDPHRGAQARSGSDAADVVVPHFWIECKHMSCPRPERALRQAQREYRETQDRTPRWPVAVVKGFRTEPFVVMGFDDFLALVSGWYRITEWHRVPGEGEP